MTFPFKGTYAITQGFMQSNAALLGGFHKGIDWALPEGTPVCAIDSGTVQATGVSNNEGRYIIVAHSWGNSQYYHLSKSDVKPGDKVFEGVNIGLSGSSGVVTGPHLHLQVYKNGILTNPLSLMAPEPVANSRGYVMPPGGNLSYAAKSLGVSLDDLIAANPKFKENPNLVYPGEVLNVPDKTNLRKYTVVSGDNLSTIAARNGMTLEQLLQKNEQFRAKPGLIHPGDEVTL